MMKVPFLLNSGITVCVNPLNGGEWRQRLTSFGRVLSAMSRITVPPSMYPM
jgi:hypothetical protein